MHVEPTMIFLEDGSAIVIADEEQLAKDVVGPYYGGSHAKIEALLILRLMRAEKRIEELQNEIGQINMQRMSSLPPSMTAPFVSPITLPSQPTIGTPTDINSGVGVVKSAKKRTAAKKVKKSPYNRK